MGVIATEREIVWSSAVDPAARRFFLLAKEMRMADGNGDGNRLNHRVASYALAFLFSCFVLSGDICLAGNLRMVRGIVGSVSGSRVSLGGRTYELAGIPVRNASGKEKSVEDIRTGTKVELIYRRGVLTSVLVYDPMME